jgi:predicted nucleotidyltransferase
MSEAVQIDELLRAEAESHPYPLLFATVSGAHLYGFPSPDSDYDLRGAHILPVSEIAGLDPGEETVQITGVRNGVEIDLVTHDIKKFFLMLLKRNGYVLEQLYSPLIVHATSEHLELKEIARGCITRQHAHHYAGFARSEWTFFEKEKPQRVKRILYVYRVLLTGIHLMRTGEVEANLVHLNELFKLPYVPDLIARKLSGLEGSTVDEIDVDFYRAEYERLTRVLEESAAESFLPEIPAAKPALEVKVKDGDDLSATKEEVAPAVVSVNRLTWQSDFRLPPP